MQKASIISLVVLSSLVLAACKGPQPEEQQLKFENGTTTQESTTGSGSQNYQLENTAPEMKGTTMKKLSDYAPIEGTSVTLTTTKGDITFELFRDKAPLTTINFLTLVKDGFYDGIVFHRVIPDFMAQVGDPLTKDPAKEAMWGTGDPGYSIADEFEPTLKHDTEGVVSMANSGPNTGGSQFFITYEPTPWLDGKHSVFGKVTSGMDVLQNITVGDKIISASYK